MACRVYVLHTLMLGLIGMSLLTYSSYYASPNFLFTDKLKIINAYESSSRKSTPLFLFYNTSQPQPDVLFSTLFSPSQSAIIGVSESAEMTNTSANNTLNVSPEISPSRIISVANESGSAKLKFKNAVYNSVNSSLTPTIVVKPKALSSTSGNALLNNSAGVVDAIDRSFLTHEIYESGYNYPNTELCPNFGSGLKLLIMITSAPSHTDARMAIRHTWGHFAQRNDVSIAFFLGSLNESVVQKSLKNEINIYNDIIIAEFIDSYNNLTLKTVSLLEWVDVYCSNVKFVMKTDDDMFINVPALINFLEKHIKDKQTIFGRLAKKWKPIRDKKSKYYVSMQQFSLPVFPDFTTGPAYLLTSDVVSNLYKKALQRTYLKLEDVFVTGIVAEELKIKRSNVNEFSNKRVSFTPCNIQRGISIHMVKYHEQFDLWKKLFDRRSKCKKL